MKISSLSLLYMAICCLFLISCQGKDTASIKMSGTTGGSDEIVERHGGLENIERLDKFITNVEKGLKDKVRLVRYTIEGDPIYHNIDYDGENLDYTVDNSEDEYGAGEVENYICKKIEMQETSTQMTYSLNGCPDSMEILTISYDVDEQDLFAFRLKYGVGQKNLIDTKKEKLVKDLQNGEMAAVSDFQFSKDELNKIYKLMIFANYLEDKNLNNQCNQKPHESYDLHVWINGAERQFGWTECDDGQDGKVMSQLVKGILKVLEENPTYQTLPEASGSYE
ncbi:MULTISPECIES: DUF4362 domain-containing protein [unclassified Bacillus (in: firmicutes)]|uniref:DUF4362 domain-containing protein n=1 Tax=unclassified Bacillus (in: firmicutes) TaxID=185979 RepID=UPI0008F14098|nr:MULTISPECIES: DUF4362 domain-containing protein [unclassified Bacillus (in: firmicutes)]SFB07907.1 protein of unknown function [Bacillus sp. UNCCL13]SFQ87183.1 protein of unknown function [Bacillus sp. cl95]